MSNGRPKSPRDKPAEKPTPAPPVHPAGPHATPELTDDEATPGAGTLPDADTEGDADAATS
jgi:hypothetical protein